MSKLSGRGIVAERALGSIVIEPFAENQLGPNSYDLRLGPKLKVYEEEGSLYRYNSTGRLVFADSKWPKVLDPKQPNKVLELDIPEVGALLAPGRVYLAHTWEVAGTLRDFVPCIEGRSSYARLGLFVHVTAGFGDRGFVGQWTLELVATQPVLIYPGMLICQLWFDTLTGPPGESYAELGRSKYAHSRGVQESRSWMDWEVKRRD